MLDRRTLMSALAAGLAVPMLARAQTTAAQQTSAWETPRRIGNPKAKVMVEEWFSLTCTHCAHFAQETFPNVQKKLIDTGKVQWEFRDFPLDRVALKAAMVARALPVEHYVPFILALFASQDRWAFAQDVDYTKELWDMAALAGMSRPTFDAVTTDSSLQNWILQGQKEAESKYNINATPSFVINGKMVSGEMSYDDFVKNLPNMS
jgi:protein-disulfide isomerase